MIIAILAGMLLPALNSARDKARDISCLSNLGSCSKIIIMYLDNYEQRLPKVSTNPGRFSDVMYSFYKPSVEQKDRAAITYLSGTSGKYIYPAPFNCPSSQDSYYDNTANAICASYGVNRCMSYSTKGMHTTKVKRPSQRGLYMDIYSKMSWGVENISPMSASDDYFLMEPVKLKRHMNRSGINVMYLDGHVAGTPLSAIPLWDDQNLSACYFWGTTTNLVDTTIQE